MVENRPGAGGALAVGAMVRSTAEGCTLLWGCTGSPVSRPLPNKVARDLAIVVQVADIPIMFVAACGSGIRSMGPAHWIVGRSCRCLRPGRPGALWLVLRKLK